VTKNQIDEVLDRVRKWPKARQDDAVEMLLAMEKLGTEPMRLSAEERADIKAALEEVERGEIAPEEEIRALFDRYRR
jgi:predicted transcriptional regulator